MNNCAECIRLLEHTAGWLEAASCQWRFPIPFSDARLKHDQFRAHLRAAHPTLFGVPVVLDEHWAEPTKDSGVKHD